MWKNNWDFSRIQHRKEWKKEVSISWIETMIFGCISNTINSKVFIYISCFIYCSRLSFVCLYLRHYLGMIRLVNVHYVIRDSNLYSTYKFKTMED